MLGNLLGVQSYAGQTRSEGGFAANKVSTAAVLDVYTRENKGKTYYQYEILTRTADGDDEDVEWEEYDHAGHGEPHDAVVVVLDLLARGPAERALRDAPDDGGRGVARLQRRQFPDWQIHQQEPHQQYHRRHAIRTHPTHHHI